MKLETERLARRPGESGARPVISAISNRELQVLESQLSYRKQTTGPHSNRELSTILNSDIPAVNSPQKNAVSFATFSRRLLLALLIFAVSASAPLAAQEKRKVIIDEDCDGPGGTCAQAVLALIQSPETDVLGITIVTGDAWRDEEVQHTLRLLEIIGRTDIPVVPGAAFPLINSKEFIARWETLYGKLIYQGAWNYASRHPVHGPADIPQMPEGAPTTKASTEDAAHFLLRLVHKYPHQVTIYEGGPLTNLALAQSIDPEFASLAKELVLMGGSLNPQTDDPEFTLTPRHELAAHRGHHRGHFCQNQNGPGSDFADWQKQIPRCAVHRKVCRRELSLGRDRLCRVA
jgi:hypothetical protein